MSATASATSEVPSATQTGISLLLITESLLFAGLFFAEGVLRLGAAHWPGVGASGFPVWLEAALTAILVAAWGCFASEVESTRRLLRVLGLVLAAGFLAGQIWISRGLEATAAGGAFASMFEILSGVHGLHVLGVGGVSLWGLWRGAESAEARVGLARLWSFLAVVQLMIFSWAVLL